MKRIIIDASSAILLYKSNLFDDLIAAYQTNMAESVFNEVTRRGYSGADHFRTCYLNRQYVVQKVNWAKPLFRRHTLVLPRFGKGERDTIFLYLDGNADFIIMDDGRGAGFCKRYDIPYINALLFARILLLSKNINERVLQNKMEMIINLGRYSQEIINYAFTCSTNKIYFFTPE